MPIFNFLPLVNATNVNSAPILRGDMVFSLTFTTPAGEVRPNHFAHVGIAAENVHEHQLNNPVNVIHLGTLAIEREPWTKSPRVEIVGTMAILDEVSRDAIIDTALAFYQMTPTVVAQKQCCYFMGDPHPHGHPTVAGSPYGFSCASFANYCYEVSLPKELGTLVNTERMPLVTADEYTWLCRNLPYPIQRFPFKRLWPSYLIRAFEIDDYPFCPENWDEWKDHSKYVPASQITVDT